MVMSYAAAARPAGAPLPDALRVLVVDDSAVQRRFLRLLLDRCPDLAVVGEARSGQEAVDLVRRLGPDVVVMDLEMPQMDGLAAIETIMAASPTPIVVHSAYLDEAQTAAVLSAGAVDVTAKPGAVDPSNVADLGADLVARVRTAARVRVITHPRRRLEPPTPPASAVDIVVIGASTGGPQALAEVLAVLPPDFGAPVLVVQHIAEGFVDGLAGWLGGRCALPVRIAKDGERLQPGAVLLAPSGQNLVVRPGLRLSLEDPPATQHHVPGIDVTFESVAAQYGSRSLGVLLTGMGRDGALGLATMRAAGGSTLVQDEQTSTVYGMPAAAVEVGAAENQLPLCEIGPEVLRLSRAAS